MMRRDVSGEGKRMPALDCRVRRDSIVEREISEADSYSLL